ncbi:MAG: YihY/virulence factor BrkB family protein [Chloroflexia bacterium]|nr:YihY/virulence factor BrkB family protein [Chloroflexia bacterium]
MEALTRRLRKAYRWLDEHTCRIPSLIGKAVESFGDTRGAEAAAGMAYYTFFSLFPLLLALIAGGSYFLEQERVYQEVLSLAREAFPLAQELIESNIQRVLELRGTVGLIGLVAALWSASGVFTILSRNINRAWPRADRRNFLQQRLVALAMIVALTVPLSLSFIASTVFNLLPQWEVPILGDLSVYDSLLWKVLSNFIPWAITFLLFLALYRWVPKTEVDWPAAFWAALVVALAWQGGSYAFSWYLGSGLVRYELVYGSLGVVAALLFWIYVSSWIILFGAHLSAAVARWREPAPEKGGPSLPEEWLPLQRILQERCGLSRREAGRILQDALGEAEGSDQ